MADMYNFFGQVGQFMGDVVDGLVKILSFLGNVGSLILNLLTVFPTRFNVITGISLGLLLIIIGYKVVRKG